LCDSWRLQNDTAPWSTEKIPPCLDKHCATNVFRAENEIIPVAGERVWPDALELTKEGIIRMLLAGKTDSSANTHYLKISTISSIV